MRCSKFLWNHLKFQICPRETMPLVGEGYDIPLAKSERGVRRGVTPRTPRLYDTMISGLENFFTTQNDSQDDFFGDKEKPTKNGVQKFRHEVSKNQLGN